MQRKVIILQHRLLHYRVDLFNLVRAMCQDRNIACRLVHGQATAAEKTKNDEGYLAWADRVVNRHFRIGGRDILWQPLPRAARDADLFIIIQENRILSNYPHLLRRRFDRSKVAFWGHGVNFQSRAPNGVRERWKRFLIGQVDWWFAYTELTAQIVRYAGFPAERITCLQNAIDTTAFRTAVESVTERDIGRSRTDLGLDADARVGIFCGSLYPDKRLDLLINAADEVRKQVPGFHLILIGSGPGDAYIDAAARQRPWLHPCGARFGRDKAMLFRLAEVMLNPGLLGLHILDAFSIGMPIVSTINARHSPEIAYLKSGENGVLVNDSVAEYANAVVKLLMDAGYRQFISSNAMTSGHEYTVERMASNFVEGIGRCLDFDKLS